MFQVRVHAWLRAVMFHMILSLREERGGDTFDLGDDGEGLDCCCCCCVLPLTSAGAAALEDDRGGGLLRS